MSTATWLTIAGGTMFIVGTEIVIHTLRRRLRRQETAYNAELYARMDEELAELQDDEGD